MIPCKICTMPFEGNKVLGIKLTYISCILSHMHKCYLNKRSTHNGIHKKWYTQVTWSLAVEILNRTHISVWNKTFSQRNLIHAAHSYSHWKVCFQQIHYMVKMWKVHLQKPTSAISGLNWIRHPAKVAFTGFKKIAYVLAGKHTGECQFLPKKYFNIKN